MLMCSDIQYTCTLCLKELGISHANQIFSHASYTKTRTERGRYIVNILCSFNLHTTLVTTAFCQIVFE